MNDEDVATLGRAVVPGCEKDWGKPARGRRSSVFSQLDPYNPDDHEW